MPIGLSAIEEEAILLELMRRQKAPVQKFPFKSLEELVTSPEGFSLSTLTPLQRAVCRLIEGRDLGDLKEHPHVIDAFGGKDALEKFPGGFISEIDILAAVRTAKSLIAAATAIWATQHCDLSMLRESGEIARFSILSLELDNAKVVLLHLLGALNKPALKYLKVDTKNKSSEWKELIDEANAGVVGSEFIWHPSGRPIEVRVVAGKRAGGSLVSRWSAGAVLDEAPRMVGSTEGVINYDDARRALLGRLLPGAQLLSIGSPWQPWGPIYQRYCKYFGAPTQNTLVIKAGGREMNPYLYTAQHCARMKEVDPIAYMTDVLAQFADAEESLFPQAILDKCTREEDDTIDYRAGNEYVAAMDPATRGNAWTLVVVTRYGRRKTVVYNEQWLGSSISPLSPKEVLSQVKEILARYHLDWCYTDQWSADANKDIALDLGFSLVEEDWTAANKTKSFLSLAVEFNNATISIPNNMVLKKDLNLTKRVPSARSIAIHLTRTPDGRHCDYAPALALALARWLEEEQPDLPTKGTEAYLQKEMDELEEYEMEQAKQGDSGWWEKDPWNGALNVPSI